MKLSVIIPAQNEEAHLPETLSRLVTTLSQAGVPHEVLVVDDHSTDGTSAVVEAFGRTHPTVRLLANTQPRGFGLAVRAGLAAYTGEAVAIVMADGSDDPGDLVRYYHRLLEGYECVFGSRFIHGSRVVGYPWHKLILNRLANAFIRLLFGVQHNDITNAFKCYRRAAIEGAQPLLAHHFNLTVELPLKAIVRGYSYATIPISWTQRKHGVSKLHIREMGSRYLFIVISVLLEKHLSRGDYRKPAGWRHAPPAAPQNAAAKVETP